MIWYSLTEITAADNSNLGIVISWIGASRAFSITKLQWILSKTSTGRLLLHTLHEIHLRKCAAGYSLFRQSPSA